MVIVVLKWSCFRWENSPKIPQSLRSSSTTRHPHSTHAYARYFSGAGTNGTAWQYRYNRGSGFQMVRLVRGRGISLAVSRPRSTTKTPGTE